jgi:IclR family pca regulon transcriptional regulator
MNNNNFAGSYFSTTIEKGLKILNLFDEERTNLTLKDISQELKINTTSAYRYVNTLVQLGYVWKDPKNKVLRLGPMALTLSNKIASSSDILQTIKPLLESALDRYKGSIDCGFLEGDVIHRVYQKGHKEILMRNVPYLERALHCSALGKAILAHLPEKEMLTIVDTLDFVPKTKHSIKNKKMLLRDLEITRKRGYAINNEEYIIGAISIAAPFINSETKKAFGAVSMGFTVLEHNVKDIERNYANTVRDLAIELSKIIPIG